MGRWASSRGHAPLLSTLDIGEIVLHKGNDSQFIAVGGGVVEVRPDKVTILADTAETPEDIDDSACRGCAGGGPQQLLADESATPRAAGDRSGAAA